MFRNYLTIAWRNFTRQRAFSVINLLGLSVGLTCAFLIALWVQHELSYDQFHQKGDRLHRVFSQMDFDNGDLTTWTTVPLAMGEVVPKEAPEVRDMAFMNNNYEYLFTYEDRSFMREGAFVSANWFEHFSFTLLEGEAKSVLDAPNSLVITESMALSLFGADGVREAMGKTVSLNRKGSAQVTGVMADPPANSSIQFGFARPIKDLVKSNPAQMNWGNFNFDGYALLSPEADPAATEVKITAIVEKHREYDNTDFVLQPLGDTYLHGKWENGQLAGGRIEYVRIFSAVAIFLLLIACINFMNLATARSAKRAREVGVRKVVGASRNMLIAQFFGEAILMAFLALLVAVIGTEALLPAFSEIMGAKLGLPLEQPQTWFTLLGIALGAGLLAGSYPALLLSSLPTLDVLRGGRFALSKGNLNLRRGLVIFQFALSILMIVASLVMVQQLDYIRSKNLGLDKEQVLSFRLPEYNPERLQQLRQKLAERPEVRSLTAANMNPIDIGNSTTTVSWDGKAEDENPVFHALVVSYDFIETFGVELLAGRSFDPSFLNDTLGSYIINEQTMAAAGWSRPKEAVGQNFSLWGQEGKVVGVVKDFHIASLHSSIEPLILGLKPDWTHRVYVKLAAGQVDAGVSAIQQAFTELAPEYPFEYGFLDEAFDRMYASEAQVSKLATIAAGLAIFVACLGLLGLAVFSAEQRTKELSIRKVLGASVPQLIVLMGREFTVLVILSFLLATPVAFWLLRDWLSQFAYRIELSLWLFTAAGIIALLIAWATIGWQSWRAAQANPADALRSE